MERKTSPAQRSVTLSALLDTLSPDTFLFIAHRLGPHELESVACGTVQQLQDSRCAEVCGENVVERVAIDDPALGMMVITIGGKEPS